MFIQNSHTIVVLKSQSFLTLYIPFLSYTLQHAYLKSQLFNVSPHFLIPAPVNPHHYLETFKKLYKLGHLFMCYKLHFRKFSFTGKGYRLICSKRYTLTFNFGFSHLFYVYNIQIKPYHLAKTKLLFVGLNYFKLQKLTYDFFNVKPLNIFTWRGLRFSKGIFRKKVGKISLYF